LEINKVVLTERNRKAEYFFTITKLPEKEEKGKARVYNTLR